MIKLAGPPPAVVLSDVARALDEDLGAIDLTAQLLPAWAEASARIVVRETAVLCGSDWAAAAFRSLDPELRLDWHYRDGDALSADACVVDLHGKARAIVSAERTALNFLQTLSATATVARQYADVVAGTGTRVLDTRKTLPGLRVAQKYAVRCGGASNHRLGLYDAVLIKENHIRAAGSISAAIAAARAIAGQRLVEIEVETRAEFAQALAAAPDRILLDDWSLEDMRYAVASNAGRVTLEISGGVDGDRLHELATLGVDYISVGALTKHLRAIDFSLRLL